MHKMIDVQSML